MIRNHTITVTGNDTFEPFALRGYLHGVHLNYATHSGTTDVTISTKGTSAPIQTILTLSNANTDGWFFPRMQVHGVTGTALTLDGTRLMVERFCIYDTISIVVADGETAGTLALTFVMDE